MPIFVLTDTFLQNLPEKETGNYLSPFIMTDEKGSQLSIDKNEILKNKYIKIIQDNKLSTVNHFCQMIAYFSSKGFIRIIRNADLSQMQENDPNIFLEVAYQTNNLSGLIIDDYNNTNMFINNNQTTYKNSTIHVYDISNAKQQINQNASSIVNNVIIGNSSNKNTIHIDINNEK